MQLAFPITITCNEESSDASLFVLLWLTKSALWLLWYSIIVQDPAVWVVQMLQEVKLVSIDFTVSLCILLKVAQIF